MSLGVIVASLQVYELDSLHSEVINSVMKKHDRTIMILRVTRVPSTKNNPLDIDTRKVLLEEAFSDIEVLSIDDHPLTKEWSRLLDEKIETQSKDEDVILYGTKKDLLNEYSGRYTTGALDSDFSKSSQVKEASHEEYVSRLFRKGMIYAIDKQYPKVFPTVDVAIFRDGRLLLAKKPNVGGYRFIGGFTDPEDENYEAAAAREAKEETGITVKDISYIGSLQIDDWRYRKETDKIITSFFKAEYREGDPAPQDDISELKWFDPASLSEEMFVQEHKALYKLLKYYMKIGNL